MAAKRVSGYSVWVFGLGQGFSGSNFRGLSLLRSGLVRLRWIIPLRLMLHDFFKTGHGLRLVELSEP